MLSPACHPDRDLLQPKPWFSIAATFGFCSDVVAGYGTMRLAYRVAAACQRGGFLVIHGHARKCFAYMQRGHAPDPGCRLHLRG